MTDKQIAEKARYYIRQGSFVGTNDDKLDHWYVGHKDEPFRPWGRGFDRPGKAWAHAAELAHEVAS